MKIFLKETEFLNFNANNIKRLIDENQWRNLNDYYKIFKIYNFVRDDIIFGYNENDRIQATKVLEDGYGQCNTKDILLMALLRGVGIPCRLHGFKVDKKMQKGVMKGIYYLLSPNEIIHTWVEVYSNSQWYSLEGVILDKKYLTKLQRRFKNEVEGFYGYGVAVEYFRNLNINWNCNNTYIQSEAIISDLGMYNSPDEFFQQYNQDLNLLKKFLYEKYIRYCMNRNVNRIRESF